MNTPLVSLEDMTCNPETLIERIARVCYNSECGSIDRRKSFLTSIIKRGHTSVLEHAKATFLIDGVSRSMTHQLVRHRIASYTQQSQRYVSAENFEYITPSMIEGNENAKNKFDSVVASIKSAYKELRDMGIPMEDARFILPNATCTKIFVTMNFRELRHFFELRCDSHAQWEIRDVAKKMLCVMYDAAPIIFGDLYEKYISEPLAEKARSES